MINIKEIKAVITTLLTENHLLRNIIFEKDKIIENLMNEVEDLKNDLEYSTINGGIKKLILKKSN